MTFYKKATIPAMVSMALAAVSTASAQDDLLFDHQIVKSPMQVQSSQVHSYHAQAHPLTQSIIVKFKKPSKNTKSALNKVATMSQKMGVNFEFKRSMSGEAEVWRVNNLQKSSFMDLQALVERLNADSSIEYAEVDAWIVPYRTPNDSRYNEQWHYKNTAGGMRLPGAWDESTGSSAVTVAVLDTGYRPHPDLVGNVVNEYDMISSSSVGNDGNGRDSNAQDPGDWVTANQCGGTHAAQDSSWHGTHVAGTVAAVSDNGSGVAGVAWNVNLVPVRVLGTCGGSLSDIADGIRWAAGLNVSGVPTNSNPADVINMSLGSSSPTSCSSTYQNAINAAYNAGTTIVVAAGNDNSSSGYPPANCSNVISVAAGANDGARAYYSNYGSSIDITAPGGDGCNPNSNSEPSSLSDCQGGVWEDSRMILSTHNSGTQGPASNNYGWLQGTSMASPHVAGLAALIKSVDGALTPAEVEQVIKDSADGFASVPDHQCTTSICGAGYANATAALQLAAGGGNPPNPGNTVLTKGVAKTGLSAAKNGQLSFTLEVPSGASNLSFTMSGGSGDGDLYVKYGSAPTTSSYDCRPWKSGNNENCDFASPQAGTYHVMINAYSAFSNVSLVGDFDENNNPPPTNGQLANGVPETGLSGGASSETFFTMDVPAGASDLSFVMSGGSGDADLYVKFGSKPTTSSYDCRPWKSGNNETCTISNAQSGTYHVMIRAYSAYSNVSLVGSYTESSGGGNQSFYQNGNNVSIPDNNTGGVTSNINVNRSGNAGTVEIKFDIVHTWRGDLSVKIIAPNGASASLHDRTNTSDSADNISKTVSVNASSVSASGTWKLEVIDHAGGDTGYIDSWSIEFQ